MNRINKMETVATNLNFGQALEALKQGKPVSREGWNGKKMSLWINWGSSTEKKDNQDNEGLIEGIQKNQFVPAHEGTVTRLPNINMTAATGSTVTGWLASQTDLLAEDWCILNDLQG